MFPIQTIRGGRIIDLRNNELYDSILKICQEHRMENRALAFGFILYNLKNPQIYKILKDKDYWRALDATSGKYLSLFYIKQNENFFGQDFAKNDGVERRGLYEIETNSNLTAILKRYFELDENVNYPAVLFFQVHNNMLADYFLLNLDENMVEESFWELQKYIEAAVTELEGVKNENYKNSSEIFNLLKSGVESQKLKRKFFKLSQSFPFQLLTSWITGKL
jgi:hypothetical protein